MSDTKFIDLIKSKYGDLVLDSHNFRGDQTVTVRKDCGNDFFKFLRDEPELAFNFLMDITAVDYLSKKTERFEVVYHFYSLKHNDRLRIKIPIPMKDCIADTITPLWKTANWYEREIWDMYGIKFRNHPDLKRILLYEEFNGHPLRKDFPLTGYTEVRYDEEQKRVAYEPVQLTQEFRRFDFMSPWEGAHYIRPRAEKEKDVDDPQGDV